MLSSNCWISPSLALPNDYFDLISACFAIYYAQDIPLPWAKCTRAQTGGRLFTPVQCPTNKAVFYDIIKEATGNPIPPMPGSSRYASEIYGTMEKLFSKVEQHIFENPLTFTDAAPFMVYTRASMSEDRKLWNSLFITHDDFEIVMDQIEKVATARIARDGSLVMSSSRRFYRHQVSSMMNNMTFYGKSVLFLGAHPDDIELGCGALLADIVGQTELYCMTFSDNKKNPDLQHLLDEHYVSMRSLGLPMTRLKSAPRNAPLPGFPSGDS
jgi:hypothetical protein